MSEYQYYEFQTIDRPLGEAEQQALRALSTRARITATSFTNSYNYGDLKGDPAKFMERWFDLHLYFAEWGSRRFMMRLPKRLVNQRRVNEFLREVDCASLRVVGENLILDICPEESEFEEWHESEGGGWLARLTPLRADVLAGDLRLFYLLWLTAVEGDAFEADEPEPMPGIGPMTPALEAFAEFFDLDPDLVQAAAERSPDTIAGSASPGAIKKSILAMTDREKNEVLVRLFDGDPHVGIELRTEVRNRLVARGKASTVAARTVGELRSRAQEIGRAREKAAVVKEAAKKKRQAQEAEKAQRTRLEKIARRGESVWAEVEREIERRNVSGYDNAASLLADLRVLADERGKTKDFARRLNEIRERHARKGQFVKRLATFR